MSSSEDLFSTGVRFLDKRLGGGIPAGGMIALITPAGSQSELLFEEIAGEQSVWYLSTMVSDEDELRDIVSPREGTPHDLTVEYITTEKLLEDPTSYIGNIDPESFVIIDTVNGLESTNASQYLSFLNELKEHLRANDSVGILHGLTDEPTPEERPLTLKRADHVWQLELAVSDRLITRLLIPKSREYQVLTEPLELELIDQVVVDTSRNIA